jgi:hypothetical protein
MLNHDDVFVRVDDEHHPAFARRSVRNADVAAGNSRVRTENREANGMERFTG